MVLDQACSMTAMREQVSAKLVALFASLDPAQLDFRVGVVGASAADTDDQELGVFLASPDGTRVLAGDAADAQARFEELLESAPVGGAAPFLIRPAWRALHADRIGAGLPNAGLYADAPLRVVIVSNSKDFDVAPIITYQNYFSTFSGGRWSLAAAIPLTLTNPTCAYATGDAAQSDRVKTLAALANGKAVDVCAADWTSALGPVLERPYEPTTVFELEHDALGSPIDVTVDGVIWDGVTDGQKWTWDSKRPDQIRFVDVPPPSSRVGVTYDVFCAK